MRALTEVGTFSRCFVLRLRPVEGSTAAVLHHASLRYISPALVTQRARVLADTSDIGMMSRAKGVTPGRYAVCTKVTFSTLCRVRDSRCLFDASSGAMDDLDFFPKSGNSRLHIAKK